MYNRQFIILLMFLLLLTVPTQAQFRLTANKIVTIDKVTHERTVNNQYLIIDLNAVTKVMTLSTGATIKLMSYRQYLHHWLFVGLILTDDYKTVQTHVHFYTRKDKVIKVVIEFSDVWIEYTYEG